MDFGQEPTEDCGQTPIDVAVPTALSIGHERIEIEGLVGLIDAIDEAFLSGFIDCRPKQRWRFGGGRSTYPLRATAWR